LNERVKIGAALCDALGEPVLVRQLDSSQRSRVWLAEFGGSPAVIKQITGGPDATERYHREISALRLAAAARPAVVPELLGTDPAARLMVLEYLAADGPTAAGWHVDYASALARLHATGRVAGLPEHTGPGPADVRAFLVLAARLGVAVPDDAGDELRRLLERLDSAARDALLHGDPCPDNAVPTATGIRFVDLEQASLGSGAVELAYLTMGFPTCWCVASTPLVVLDEARAAYRTTWRQITGAEPNLDLTDACAGWVVTGDALVERARRHTIDHLGRLLRGDWQWGTVTARERLAHRLGVVAGAARNRADLGRVAWLCTAMRNRMLDRWPELAVPPVAAGDPLDAVSGGRS
jgi:phosphotransferase family enzyme